MAKPSAVRIGVGQRSFQALAAVKPRDAKNLKQKKTAKLIADFYKAALPIIAKEKPANGFLMRGIASSHLARTTLPCSSPRASRFIRCIKASRSSSAW